MHRSLTEIFFYILLAYSWRFGRLIPKCLFFMPIPLKMPYDYPTIIPRNNGDYITIFERYFCTLPKTPKKTKKCGITQKNKLWVLKIKYYFCSGLSIKHFCDMENTQKDIWRTPSEILDMYPKIANIYTPQQLGYLVYGKAITAKKLSRGCLISMLSFASFLDWRYGIKIKVWQTELPIDTQKHFHYVCIVKF